MPGRVGQIVAAAAKVCLAAGLLALAPRVWDFSTRLHERQGDPEEAFALHPTDGVALSRVVAARLAADPGRTVTAAECSAALSALRARPLDAGLLALSGLCRSAAGREAEAGQFFVAAGRVSRRDLVSQLALIELRSASGDVGETLRHYNAAMSVYPQARGLLFPVLVSGLQFGEIRDGLSAYLARPDRWGGWEGGLLRAAAEGAEVETVLELVGRLGPGLRSTEYEAAHAILVRRLALSGRRGEAIAFAGRAFSDFNAAEFFDFGPTPASLDPRLGKLSWQTSGRGGVRAYFEAPNSFRLNVDPLSRGAALGREFMLDAGSRHRLTFSIAPAGGPGGMRLRWSAACLTGAGASQFWEQIIPAAEAEANFGAEFVAPVSCHLARVTLSATGPDGPSAAAAQLSNLELRAI